MESLTQSLTSNGILYSKTISIYIGDDIIEHDIVIKCPNDPDTGKEHVIVRNGRDTSTKEIHQQYRCKTCGRSFYAHTSRFYLRFINKLPKALEEAFSKGKLSISALAGYFNIPKYTASRLMNKFLERAAENLWEYTPFHFKIRRSSTLYIDETFLKINGEDYFLTVAVTENREVVGFHISRRRNYEELAPQINRWASRLEYGLKVLVTDGFSGYRTYANKYGKDLIHVQHIHKPPYGRVEITKIHYDLGRKYSFTFKTRNDILNDTNGFLAEVRVKREYLDYKCNLPKYSSSNASALGWELERLVRVCQKTTNSIRNLPHRPKPPGKKWKNSWWSFFVYDYKKGRVTSLDKNLDKVAAELESLLPLFAKRAITSNLIEIEHGLIKKCIRFGVKRDLFKWQRLVEVYFAIRDQPLIISGLVRDVSVSKQMLRRLAPRMVEVSL